MSSGNNGGPEWPSIRENDAVGEESAVHSISSGDSAGRSVVVTVDSGEEEARVSLFDADKSSETKASDTREESAVLKAENDESRLGGASEGALENPPSFSVSGGHLNGNKNTDIRNGISEIKKVGKTVADYDSVLSEFDQFVSEGVGEAVGSGYEIGDMVWGKVKSHPWWPGHVYNEAFASHSVHRSKREGHVLVAFFGDSSYGWFHPSELVPFEENFAEKSRQTSSRAFVKAVEEAVDEISRRQGVGLACCCRNEFNFRPSTMADHFVVDVGDYEPGVYSLSQINKAREDFRTNELLLFVQQLALKPMTDQHWNIEFIKNRSTLLGCRKAFFEEFDDTYAQAFGTVPERPLRPTAPMAVDPSKALLSGRQVFAETPSKGKIFVKSTKSKEQVEKDNYLFIRRDAPVHTKTKKTSSVQVGPSGHPLLVDGLGLTQIPVDSSIKSQTSISGIYDGQHEPPSDKASVVGGIQLYEASKKLVDESGQKKANVRKRPVGLSAENATLDIKKAKKRKKEIGNESSANMFKLPLANSLSGAAMEKDSGMLLDVPLGNRKKDDSIAHQEVVDLRLILVRDLRALALDPFYGVERNCPASTQLAFLKYRSLVYQKSLVSLPSTGNEAIEAHTITLPASNALRTPNDKSTMRYMKHSTRHIDDPTIGGKKRGPSDRPETIKKYKLLVDPQGINKKMKIAGSEEVKKKKILANSKLMDGGKKIQQRPTESQREAADARNIPPKAVKHESSSKKMNEQPTRVFNPTMLVMKFPPSATLPSGNELKAKFARFGALDLNATRIFWKTSTCRLVYRRKVDAEEALEFAVGSNSLFGSTRVRCYVREVEVEPSVESEPVKASQSRESTFEHYNRPSANTGSQQLKSCLKKPTNDEGSNGNGRGTRVKFILGGGEGSGSKTNEQLSSLPVGVDPSLRNNEHSMESTGIKNLPKLTPHTPVVTPLMPNTNNFTTTTTTTITNNNSVIATHHQLQKSPINMTTPELLPLNLPPPTLQKPSTKDISHQLLNLLTRCSDVVNNVTGVLGYRPYHAL